MSTLVGLRTRLAEVERERVRVMIQRRTATAEAALDRRWPLRGMAGRSHLPRAERERMSRERQAGRTPSPPTPKGDHP